MKKLKVKGKTVQVHYTTLQERMIEDLRQCDMDTFKAIAEAMYPVVIEDVDGAEGEEIHITIDEQEAPGCDLEDIF